ILESQNNGSRLGVIQKAVQQSNQFILEKKEQLPNEHPDIDLLKQQGKELQTKAQALERVLDVCKENNKLHLEKDSLTKELNSNSKEILIREKELGEIGQALKISQKYLDELNIRRERELLEAKYEDARQLLKPDEACPLCGSIQHPYVNNYKSQKNKTEEALKEKNVQHKDLLQREKVTLEQLSKHKSSLASVEKRLNENSEKQEQYKIIVQQLTGKYELKFEDVNEQTVVSAIESNSVELKQLEQQINTIEKLDKAIIRNKEYSMLANEMEALIQLHRQVNEAFITLGINSEMPLSEKLTILKEGYVSYAQKKEQLQDQEKEYTALNIAWKEKGKQLQELMQTFAKQNDTLAKNKQELENQKSKRESLFGTKIPEELEDELSTEKRKLEETQKTYEIKLQKSAVLSNTLSGRLKEIDEELREEQIKLLKRTEALSGQLKSKGLNSIEEALDLLISEEEVKQLQNKQEGFVKASTELNHSIKSQKKQLDQLQDVVENIQYSEAELQNNLSEMELQLKTGLGKAGSLQQKIKTDTENKEKQKEKVQVIEKQQKNFNRWDELSSLIGDATGNKFSRFAQELTLKQVLQLANNHLKLLTDRYLVKHVKSDNTDELFVVDMYHGNAERSVKTLSGGESFLVSLSLALGLSDLAGQNTVIGSLFIDEGFGTLDQNTLDVALSALEKLQSETNRTIGIISHVPALKERVTTQIELRKDASGYSTLEVRS
ncbi:MAG: hypothetical protein MI866_19275, partial [Bacteroidales bacterium]|nr:hypothetical protein [Bacteroidales bacterium]